MASVGALVASIALRIESGEGGPDTDHWYVDVEVGPGITVRDPEAMVRRVLDTLAADGEWIAGALRASAA